MRDVLHRDVLQVLHNDLLTRAGQGKLSPDEQQQLIELNRILFYEPVTTSLLDSKELVEEFDAYRKQYELDKQITKAFLVSIGLERDYWIFYDRMKRRLSKKKTK